jgi:hypothetical protein
MNTKPLNHDDLTIPLSRPVTAHGEEIDCLTLRQPTTADLIELGQPMRLLPGNGMEEPAIEVRMNVVAHYVARLAAVPLSSVKALSLGDFGRATQAVLGFFGEGEAPAGAATNSSPTGSSSLPGSSKHPRATS